MAKKRTSQLLAELAVLARAAEKNLYQRIGLAAEVLHDLDWIASVHGGSDLQAADALQDEYFRDLGGYVSLGKLILMYSKITAAEWETVKFDVAAVEVLYDDLSREAHEKGERTSWKKVAEERGVKLDDLQKQVSLLLEANGKLREENIELRAKVSRLEGRIEEMDRRTLVGSR
jgi:hypothetical protein